MPKLDYAGVREVPISVITVTDQIRVAYDEGPLQEFSASLKGTGLISPIIVRKTADAEKMDLVVGSRRLKAAEIAGETTIPAHVLDADECSDREKVEMMLVENLHRENLTPFEETRALLMLTQEHGLTIGEIAERIGRSATFVTNRLKSTAAPEAVQKLVAQRKLTSQHVEKLINLPTAEEQIRYAEKAVKEKIPAAELGEEIRLALKRELKRQKKPRPISIRAFCLWLKLTDRRIERRTLAVERECESSDGILEVKRALESLRGKIDFVTRRLSRTLTEKRKQEKKAEK